MRGRVVGHVGTYSPQRWEFIYNWAVEPKDRSRLMLFLDLFTCWLALLVVLVNLKNLEGRVRRLESARTSQPAAFTGMTFQCQFDNSPVNYMDYVQLSTRVDGACHDYGPAHPVDGRILGRVLQTGPSTSTVLVTAQ